MEAEIRPEPTEEERALLVEAIRVVRETTDEDRRGPWGRSLLEPDEDASR